MIFEGVVRDITYEDSRMAAIADIEEDVFLHSGPFVRLQSWDEAEPPQHEWLESLLNHRVRVTVEVLDP